MPKDNKYKMFKEFMYNELGITKEDIKEWTKEAVYETAANYVEHQFSVMDLDARIRRIMMDNTGWYVKKDVERSVKNMVAESLAKQFTVTLLEKEDE